MYANLKVRHQAIEYNWRQPHSHFISLPVNKCVSTEEAEGEYGICLIYTYSVVQLPVNHWPVLQTFECEDNDPVLEITMMLFQMFESNQPKMTLALRCFVKQWRGFSVTCTWYQKSIEITKNSLVISYLMDCSCCCLHIFAENFQALQETWLQAKEVSRESESHAGIGGIAKQMESLELLFGVHLGQILITMTDNLASALQESFVSVNGQNLVKVVKTLQSMQSEEFFDALWKSVQITRQNLKAKTTRSSPGNTSDATTHEANIIASGHKKGQMVLHVHVTPNEALEYLYTCWQGWLLIVLYALF